MTDVTTIPPTFTMASTETLPLAIDMSPLLADGEEVTNPVVTLIDLRSWEAYPAGLVGIPVQDGAIIQQTVTGLAPGRSYRLIATAQTAPGKVQSSALVIEVPW